MAQWSASNCCSRHKPMILNFISCAGERSGRRSPLVMMDNTCFAWDVVERLAQVPRASAQIRRQIILTNIRATSGGPPENGRRLAGDAGLNAVRVHHLRQPVDL